MSTSRIAIPVAASYPARFHSLDTLRGLAALSVVLWHWQHFFYIGSRLGEFDPTRQPLFNWLEPFYRNGWLAVDLFFSLSGFVFYWLYSRPIAERRLAAWNFSVLRFSRLYPLHLATLLFVAVLQGVRIARGDPLFVYEFNDLYHFVLNLTMSSSWGMERGTSFNHPIWSVSVEVALYGLFFLACRFLPRSLPLIGALSIAGFVAVTPLYEPLGRGVGSFFAGGCAFLVMDLIVRSGLTRAAAWTFSAITMACWLLAIAGAPSWLAPDGPVAQCGAFSSVGCFYHTVAFKLRALGWAPTILFPLTVLTLALVETRRGSLGARLSFLGEISYSSYLLHFPMQLLFVESLAVLGWRVDLYSPMVMTTFLGLLVCASIASYRLFEVPSQRAIRSRAQRR